MGIAKLLFASAFVTLCLNSLPASSCQSVEQRFKFPNSDVYLRTGRSTQFHYQVMKGKYTFIKNTFFFVVFHFECYENEK